MQRALNWVNGAVSLWVLVC